MRNDESAAASAMAFIAAGVVFTAAIGIILYNVSNKVGEPTQSTLVTGTGPSAQAVLRFLTTEDDLTSRTTLLDNSGQLTLSRVQDFQNPCNPPDCSQRLEDLRTEFGLTGTGIEVSLTMRVLIDPKSDDPGASDYALEFGAPRPASGTGVASAATTVSIAENSDWFATITVYVFPA